MNGDLQSDRDYSMNAAGTGDTPRRSARHRPRVRARQADNGFDWGDAGIGAAFVLVLLATGLVAVLLRRRSPDAISA